MADNGMVSLGLSLKRGNGSSPETFTPVAEVTDVNGPNIKLDTVEVQNLQDTWKARKPTFLDAGDVKLTVNFVPADSTQGYSSGVLSDMVAKTLRTWEISFPDSGPTIWKFSAFVTDFQIKGPLSGKLTAEITLTCSGAPVLA